MVDVVDVLVWCGFIHLEVPNEGQTGGSVEVFWVRFCDILETDPMAVCSLLRTH